MTPAPPRLARWMLRAVTPEKWWHQLEGDLLENYVHHWRTRGARAAYVWYWRQVWSRDTWRLWALRDASAPGPPRGWTNRLSDVALDVRYGVRSWRRQPSVAVIALATLALGIGATTAIFTVVHSVLLKPLPYESPEQLTMVFRTVPRLGFTRSTASYPDFVDWRAQARSFTDMAAYGFVYRTHRTPDGAERWEGYRVTTNLLSVLGAVPMFGRGFSEADGIPGTPPTMLLSHALWSSRFGSDPGVVGRSVVLDDQTHTVIGVMSADFDYPSRRAEFWTSLREDPDRSERDTNFLTVLARLAPNISVETAQREMTALAARIDREAPAGNREYGVFVEARHAFVVGNARAALLMFLGAVGCVLLVAMANVANLLLARGTGRRRELAMRTALGAGRGRLVRQLLTESVMLGGLGGLLGLGVAVGLLEVLLALGPAELPRLHEIRIDGLVLLVTVAVSVASGVAFGVFPAVLGARLPPHDALKDGGHGAGMGRWGRRVQRGLVVGEIALAMSLTVGAGLLINSFVRLTSVDPGFAPEQVMAARVSPPRPQRLEVMDEAGMRAAMAAPRLFLERVAERVTNMPGVVHAGLAYGLPFSARSFGRVIEPEGFVPTDGAAPIIDGNVVQGDYFAAMGIPVVQGRGFLPADTPDGPPVMVVNRTMADAYWPDADAVGKRVKVGDGPDRPWITVVGVVPDVRRRSLAEENSPMYYRPFSQAWWPDGMYVVVRSSAPSSEIAAALRREIQLLDPGVPVTEVTTIGQLVAESVAEPRYRTIVMGVFGGLALALAVVGIYGVIAFSVGDRRREFGIRLALGAERTRVVTLILRQGMVLALIGIGVGLVVTLALVGILSDMLFAIDPVDPFTYAFAAVTMLAVAVAACLGPARRAARIDPIESVRYE